ncbi:MAG: PKD domain-containing protein, partial [Gammaproteobacteria bacterium]
GSGDGAVAGPGTGGQPSGPQLGTVGIVITDAPSDRFDRILATITRIELLGDDGPVIVFDGIETIDLKALASFSELFAVADVNAGSYEKIRLTVTDLELVSLNDDGTVDESIRPKLPANGKIDLNPRGSFLVTDGGSLVIEMDFDVKKSIKIHSGGNGKYHFRPVVFVRVLDDVEAGRLSRIFGRIGRVDADTGRFELCQKELMSDLDDDSDFDSDDLHCVEVTTAVDTGIFTPTGDPADFGAIMTGDPATVIGFISGRDDRIRLSASSDDDSDDDSDSDSDSDSDDDSDSDSDDDSGGISDRRLTLAATVIELGEAGTFARVKGTAQAGIDDQRRFDLLIAPGQGFVDASIVTAQLQDGSKVYSRRGVLLDDSAIADGVMGLFDGVLMLSDSDPDRLKTVLAILDLDVSDDDVLRGQILTAGDDRRLMVATETGDRCVDVPTDTDIFLVELVEGRLVSERGEYADLQPELMIDVYGEEGSDGCFVADTIIADETDVTPPPTENRPPVANAGDDRNVATGTGAMLDGSGSSDPDGDTITYGWSLEVPASSAAMLNAADTAMPSFTTDVDGDYIGTLVVNDGELDSAPDSVTVTASATPPANRAPVADAGPNQSVNTGSAVALDGTDSSDPDGDTITHAWTLSAPAGSSATLSGADTATPSFTPDVDGDYVATLVVNDGNLDSDPDMVTVTASTTISLNGFVLYADNCERCHNPIGNSDINNRTAAGIQRAIDNNEGGMGFLSTLTSDEVQAISDALLTTL